jgi:hypothetical protein
VAHDSTNRDVRWTPVPIETAGAHRSRFGRVDTSAKRTSSTKSRFLYGEGVCVCSEIWECARGRLLRESEPHGWERPAREKLASCSRLRRVTSGGNWVTGQGMGQGRNERSVVCL